MLPKTLAPRSLPDVTNETRRHTSNKTLHALHLSACNTTAVQLIMTIISHRVKDFRYVSRRLIASESMSAMHYSAIFHQSALFQGLQMCSVMVLLDSCDALSQFNAVVMLQITSIQCCCNAAGLGADAASGTDGKRR